MKSIYILVRLDSSGHFRQSNDLIQFDNYDDAYLECLIRNGESEFIFLPANVADGIHLNFDILDLKGAILDV